MHSSGFAKPPLPAVRAPPNRWRPPLPFMTKSHGQNHQEIWGKRQFPEHRLELYTPVSPRQGTTPLPEPQCRLDWADHVPAGQRAAIAYQPIAAGDDVCPKEMARPPVHTAMPRRPRSYMARMLSAGVSALMSWLEASTYPPPAPRVAMRSRTAACTSSVVPKGSVRWVHTPP